MGVLKLERKSPGRPSPLGHANGTHVKPKSNCINNTVWILSVMSFIGSIGFLYFIQFHEIYKLKGELKALQSVVLLQEQHTSKANTEFKIDTELKSVVQRLVEETISSHLPTLKGNTEHFLRSAQPDHRNLVSRQTTGEQTCCTALQKPGFLGASYQVVTSYIGNDVLIPCNPAGFPPPKVTFNPALDSTNNNRYAQTQQGLEIHNVQTLDSGTFTCTIENVFGKVNKTIQLIVTDPVIVTTSRRKIIMNEGNTISIGCDATGTPPPNVTWSHVKLDGQTEQLTGSLGGRLSISLDNTLTIRNATATDTGSYTCTGKNKYETNSDKTDVFITGTPVVINPPKSQTALEGDTIIMNCTVASYPAATVTWTFPLTGNVPPLNGYVYPNNSIILSNVDKYNNGKYTCTATNGQYNITANATLTVGRGTTVTATPHLLPMVGTESVLNFQCTADGDPKPSVTWSKVGAPSLYGDSKYLILPGGNLIITSPTLNTDTGVYECYGENRHNNATDRVIVYQNLGSINCSTTFNDIGCGENITCGATCPASCGTNITGNSVYGTTNYASDSSVCLSAHHRGVLPLPGNTMTLFTHTTYGTFVSSLRNGIKSDTHSPGDSYEFVRVPPNSGSSGNVLIG